MICVGYADWSKHLSEQVGRAWIGVSFTRGTPALWEARIALQAWMDVTPARACRVRANVYGRFDMFIGAEWSGHASKGLAQALRALSAQTGPNAVFESETYVVIKDMLAGPSRDPSGRSVDPVVEPRLEDENLWRRTASGNDGSEAFADRPCMVVGIRVNPNSIDKCAAEICRHLDSLAKDHDWTLDQVPGDLDLLLTVSLHPDKGMGIEATDTTGVSPGTKPRTLFDALRAKTDILATETFIGHGMVRSNGRRAAFQCS